MWKEAKSRGRTWQWKYQNQGICEAHCDCKRKGGIFKIDLFWHFCFFFLKRFVIYFCSLVWGRATGPGSMRSPASPAPRSDQFFWPSEEAPLIGEKEWRTVNTAAQAVHLAWGDLCPISLEPSFSVLDASLSFVLWLEAAFMMYFPSVTLWYLP